MRAQPSRTAMLCTGLSSIRARPIEAGRGWGGRYNVSEDGGE